MKYTFIILIAILQYGCSCNSIAPQKVTLNPVGVFTNNKQPDAIAINGNNAMASLEYCPGGNCNTIIQCMAYNGKEWEIIQTLEPAFDSTSCSFGNDIAIDGNFAVVGQYAPCFKNFPRAYVYELSNGKWEFRQLLLPNDTSELNLYGYGASVDIKGDYIVVSNENVKTEDANRGCAYIFKRRIDKWVQVAKLQPDNVEDFGFFGIETALGDDVCMISSGIDYTNSYKSGCVHIFRQKNNLWSETQILRPDGTNVKYSFGRTLDFHNPTLIASSTRGSYLDPDQRVYVYRNLTGSFFLDTIFENDIGGFGFDVSVSKSGIYIIENSPGKIHRYVLENKDWKQTQLIPEFGKNKYTFIESYDDFLMIGGRYGIDTSAAFFQKMY
jgi:hypothetical protein